MKHVTPTSKIAWFAPGDRKLRRAVRGYNFGMDCRDRFVRFPPHTLNWNSGGTAAAGIALVLLAGWFIHRTFSPGQEYSLPLSIALAAAVWLTIIYALWGGVRLIARLVLPRTSKWLAAHAECWLEENELAYQVLNNQLLAARTEGSFSGYSLPKLLHRFPELTNEYAQGLRSNRTEDTAVGRLAQQTIQKMRDAVGAPPVLKTPIVWHNANNGALTRLVGRYNKQLSHPSALQVVSLINGSPVVGAIASISFAACAVIAGYMVKNHGPAIWLFGQDMSFAVGALTCALVLVGLALGCHKALSLLLARQLNKTRHKLEHCHPDEWIEDHEPAWSSLTAYAALSPTLNQQSLHFLAAVEPILAYLARIRELRHSPVGQQEAVEKIAPEAAQAIDDITIACQQAEQATRSPQGGE